MTDTKTNLVPSEYGEKKYYAGEYKYHTKPDCAKHDQLFKRDVLSLIDCARSDLEPCGKCSPPSPPIEYAYCEDCCWDVAVSDLDRDRGYRGACQSCGSAMTKSRFEKASENSRGESDE